MGRSLAVFGDDCADRCRYWLTSHPRKAPPWLSATAMPRAADPYRSRGVFAGAPRGLGRTERFHPLPATGRGASLFSGRPKSAVPYHCARRSGNLSFDALSWLSEQNVPLIRINWRGEVVIAVGIGNARNPAGRHPIPRDWHFVGNATHPVNSILNYGYSILESQIRIQLVAAGLDPTIGVLHSGRRGRSDFVLDLMEPLRPIIDRCLNSCRHRRFNRRIS